MKQLFIIKSTAALNGGAAKPTDLTYEQNSVTHCMNAGSIGFYKLNAPNAWIANNAKPDTDFAIVYGRGDKSPAIIIPEVDFGTLHVTIAEPKAGVSFTASITIPTTVNGSTYTLVLVKKGAVPHERNTWTATETVYDATTQTASVIAGKLRKYFERMAETGSLNVTVGGSGAVVTLTAASPSDVFTLKAADDLMGVAVTETAGVPATGDKADIQKLASMCAQNRGFSDTQAYGDSIYPGYPMEVEDTTYRVITLRFAVGRKSAKTRDERVSQLVHIAVPVSAALASTLKTMFTITGKTRYDAD